MSMNLSDEHPNIVNRDWRLQAITTLVEDWHSPSGVIHKAGTPVQNVGFIRYPGKDTLLSIPVLNPCAMYFSIAFYAKEEAEIILSELDENILEKEFLNVSSEYEGGFVDALQFLVSVVVFSYSAIEVFANESIPDDFVFERARQDKKYKEVYSKDQIERFLSLTSKLDEVLPTIYSLSSPKGTRIWNDFVWLEKLRDRFIHLKSTDWEKSNPDKADDFVWTTLLSKETLQAPSIALQVVNYYYQTDKPRWLRKVNAGEIRQLGKIP